MIKLYAKSCLIDSICEEARPQNKNSLPLLTSENVYIDIRNPAYYRDHNKQFMDSQKR